MQIIDSLEHCSTRNVFHRDVKLENILVVPTTLQITLIDFGCGSFYKDTSFTDFAGTPQYYPPEWFLNRKYNGYRQTIWSCGVLLYSLITGMFCHETGHETGRSRNRTVLPLDRLETERFLKLSGLETGRSGNKTVFQQDRLAIEWSLKLDGLEPGRFT